MLPGHFPTPIELEVPSSSCFAQLQTKYNQAMFNPAVVTAEFSGLAGSRLALLPLSIGHARLLKGPRTG